MPPIATDSQAGLGAESQPNSAPGPRRRGVALDVAILALAAIVGALGMKFFGGEVYSIPSLSMQNTLTAGERIIAEKVTYYGRDPQVGDVVVFDGSGLFDEPVPGATTFVKRVIGVGGDHIICCEADGRLIRNGQPVDESSYLMPGDAPSATRFNVEVPAGKLWVMGDHRSDSADSRAYIGRPGGGFIPTERVVGKAMAVAWPLSSARWIASGN